MSSFTSGDRATMDRAPNISRRSTRTSKASLRATLCAATSALGVKRPADDILTDQCDFHLERGRKTKKKRSPVKNVRADKSATNAAVVKKEAKHEGVHKKVIETIADPVDAVAVADLDKQHQAKPEPQAKLEPETKPKKKCKPVKAPKSIKVSKAAMERAKLDEVRNDPHFGFFNEDTIKRIAKVYIDRMYLIHRYRNGDMLKEQFDVYGSKGNVYKVTLAESTSCTCFDFALRKQVCKHMLFVYLKVLRLSSHMPVYSQLALAPADLCDVFAQSRQDPIAEAMAEPHLRKAWESAVGYKPALPASSSQSTPVIVIKPEGKRMIPAEGDVCGVCYEDLEPGSEEGLDFCLRSCGRPIHTDCLATWIRSRPSGNATCIWCRAVWHTVLERKTSAARNQDLQTHGYASARHSVRDSNTGFQLNLAHIVAQGSSSQI